MSIISLREGFFGLLVSACFAACIGFPQFQQNAYLSSIAEPQCWQTPPDSATTGGGASDGGASVSMSPGGIAGSAILWEGIAGSAILWGGIAGSAILWAGIAGSAILSRGISTADDSW